MAASEAAHPCPAGGELLDDEEDDRDAGDSRPFGEGDARGRGGENAENGDAGESDEGAPSREAGNGVPELHPAVDQPEPAESERRSNPRMALGLVA